MQCSGIARWNPCGIRRRFSWRRSIRGRRGWSLLRRRNTIIHGLASRHPSHPSLSGGICNLMIFMLSWGWSRAGRWVSCLSLRLIAMTVVLRFFKTWSFWATPQKHQSTKNKIYMIWAQQETELESEESPSESEAAILALILLTKPCTSYWLASGQEVCQLWFTYSCENVRKTYWTFEGCVGWIQYDSCRHWVPELQWLIPMGEWCAVEPLDTW